MNPTDSHNKVIAAVDQSHYSETVARYGQWMANQLDLSLELLHVVDRHPERASKADDHSGAIGIDAQETLLADLSLEDEQRTRQKREAGREFLAILQNTLAQTTVQSVDIKQRLGDLEEALSSEQDSTRVFVMGRRGRSAEITHRDLGRNLERVVRALHQPILTVTDTYTEPSHALFAFDGSSRCKRGIRWLANNSSFNNLAIDIVIAGKDSRSNHEQLGWCKTKLEKRGYRVATHIIQGDPETVIANQINERNINLLIMGAYSHSPLRNLLFGSRTADLLRSATVPALLLR
jgi:nucleotide-binding universal stress UspA family protein